MRRLFRWLFSPIDPKLFDNPPAHQNESVDFERISLYAYDILHVAPWLSLTGGVVWDSMEYPDNFRTTPINGDQASLDRISPQKGHITGERSLPE